MSSPESNGQTLGSIDHRYLSFEQPIGELQEQINELRRVNSDKDLNLDEDILDGHSLWITFQYLWIFSLNSMVIECSVMITPSSRD